MYYTQMPHYNTGDRFFFFPFLGPLILGGIGGAAIAGASRPRPVFVTPPYPMYPPMSYPHGYNQSTNYSYY